MSEPTALPASGLRPRPDVELGHRAEVRVEKFLDAATEVFSEKGYRNARLSDVVARAGGSMATLYRAFGDKEGLAHAIIERCLGQLMDPLQDLELSGRSPEQALRGVAMRIAESLATPDSRVLHRIMIGEGQSFPELRDWFFNHSVDALREKLAVYFEQETAAGRLCIDAPRPAANYFFMMLFGDWVIRISSGNLHETDAAALRAQAVQATDLFLRGALPR